MYYQQLQYEVRVYLARLWL